MTAAKAGILRTQRFFRELGMPDKLSEVGIDDSRLSEMAAEAIRTSLISLVLSVSGYRFVSDHGIIKV